MTDEEKFAGQLRIMGPLHELPITDDFLEFVVNTVDGLATGKLRLSKPLDQMNLYDLAVQYAVGKIYEERNSHSFTVDEIFRAMGIFAGPLFVQSDDFFDVSKEITWQDLVDAYTESKDVLTDSYLMEMLDEWRADIADKASDAMYKALPKDWKEQEVTE